MLEFQGDMVGSIGGFILSLFSVLLKTEQKAPFQQAQYHQYWGYLLWGKLGEVQKATFIGPKPNCLVNLLLKLYPTVYLNKM